MPAVTTKSSPVVESSAPTDSLPWQIRYYHASQWRVPRAKKPGETQPWGKGGRIVRLASVRTSQHVGFDRISFEFRGSFPGCRFYYQPQPWAGDKPVDFGDANAFLAIRFTGATLRDDRMASRAPVYTNMSTLQSYNLTNQKEVSADLGLKISPKPNELREVRVVQEQQEARTAEGMQYMYLVSIDVKNL